jgi:lysophospholipase L1-like esterase
MLCATLRLSLVTSALGLCLSSWAAPQLSPQPVQAPAGLSAVASAPVARTVPGEAGLAYQWPGAYFELNFEGSSAYFKLGAGAVILRVSVDGQALPLLTKPAAGVYAVSELAPGAHALRLEVLTEHQAGPNRFGGFLLPADAKAQPALERARRIEFIGDSHTVGYGNTSNSRDCTQDQVWATTDNTQAYGPITARHYNADYRVTAISGRGVVRNYDGFASPKLPEAYPHTLLDPTSPRDTSDWQPQVVAMALGTNDFSTPLKAGEAWPTREALQADFRQRYAAFLKQLRARYPQALLVVWATDGAAGEILTQAAAVVQGLQREGERRIRLVPMHGLDMMGCHWHPSLADHRKIAKALVSLIDAEPEVWPQGSPAQAGPR